MVRDATKINAGSSNKTFPGMLKKKFAKIFRNSQQLWTSRPTNYPITKIAFTYHIPNAKIHIDQRLGHIFSHIKLIFM